MNRLTLIGATIVETLMRLFPFPSRTGLVAIGNPDRNSPVFLTCNFHLTVLRVRRALRDINAYLLIANSRGINVWCAATGGHLTNHEVVAALKTSGIDELVDHRKLILPQLAATGVESRIIAQKTGWRVIWGPVYAENIEQFIAGDFKKVPELREVRFPLSQRIEMAIAWAFPISAIAALLLMIVWQDAVLPTVIFVWTLSLLIFLSFPLYESLFRSREKETGSLSFDFGRGGFQFLLWLMVMLGLTAFSVLADTFTPGFILRWGIILTIIVLVISIDLMGSTPVYKSGMHPDRLFRIALNDQCTGAGLCEQVCPRNCYEIDREKHRAAIPRSDRCVQCGACIVQCPRDALSFINPAGETLSPDIIRRYKLNLMGKRQ
jgi:NAD-dependent dihydropyrimidine dehydrogenase PreA subunit